MIIKEIVPLKKENLFHLVPLLYFIIILYIVFFIRLSAVPSLCRHRHRPLPVEAGHAAGAAAATEKGGAHGAAPRDGPAGGFDRPQPVAQLPDDPAGGGRHVPHGAWVFSLTDVDGSSCE